MKNNNIRLYLLIIVLLVSVIFIFVMKGEKYLLREEIIIQQIQQTQTQDQNSCIRSKMLYYYGIDVNTCFEISDPQCYERIKECLV